MSQGYSMCGWCQFIKIHILYIESHPLMYIIHVGHILGVSQLVSVYFRHLEVVLYGEYQLYSNCLLYI